MSKNVLFGVENLIPTILVFHLYSYSVTYFVQFFAHWTQFLNFSLCLLRFTYRGCVMSTVR